MLTTDIFCNLGPWLRLWTRSLRLDLLLTQLKLLATTFTMNGVNGVKKDKVSSMNNRKVNLN